MTRAAVQSEPFTRTAISAVYDTVSSGAARYKRAIHLPYLINVGEASLADGGAETTRQIIDRLEAAARAEEARGKSQHWTFSVSRLTALKQALAAERAHLAEVEEREASLRVAALAAVVSVAVIGFGVGFLLSRLIA